MNGPDAFDYRRQRMVDTLRAAGIRSEEVLRAIEAGPKVLPERPADPVVPYRMEDAEVAILTIGSMAETLRATVDWATQNTDLRVGAVQLLCLRPFPAADVVRALSEVRAVAVIARLGQRHDLALPYRSQLPAELPPA